MNALARTDLSTTLLAGLARFRADPTAGNRELGESLFTYCALARERLRAVVLPDPLIGIVLSGSKEIWRGLSGTTLDAGTVFVLPAGVAMDILNVPDPGRGFYMSLILPVPADIRRTVAAPPQAAGADVAVRLTPQLVETIHHAARAIAAGGAGPRVRAARMAELVALVAEDPAGGPLADDSTRARVVRLVGADLARPWAAPAVARALGLSEATLRRRLAAEGTCFRSLLRAERMALARRLSRGGASVQSAAAAAGYASRAHFARQYRAAYGANPSRATEGA